MILAAQYYRPPFPEKPYWKEDLTAMKAAGLNALQLWVLWGWVEPEPGVFNFADYDELFEEARRQGLGVVLSSIAEVQPYWINRVIPGSAMIDHMGHVVISSNRGEANQGLTPGGCTDHPEVSRHMGNFLETLATRYRSQDNFLGWDIWNELRWNVQADGLVCFCPHTLAAFRTWLGGKYGDLAGLNAAWKRRYSDWADVMPGKLPRRPYTDMMEFESFLQWRAAQHMKFRAEIIKRVDPGHIVTAHGAQPSVHSAGDMENHAINRGNDWDLAEPLDGIGCSHFPFWFGMSDDDFGVRVECTRAAAGGKTIWVSELQGGSARQGFDVRPSVQAKPQQRWVWNGYGRGAKAIIFWCWRDEIFGRESSGYGLAGLDGLAGERIAALRDTGEILKRHSDLLQAYQPDPARIGVWFDPNTYNLEWAQDGVAARARDSIVAYLTAFERIQLPYTVVESSHLAPLADLELLIMPFPLVVPAAAQQAIVEFVKRGGTLLVEAEAGAYTEQGFYQIPGPERPFATGLELSDLGRRPLADPAFTLRLAGEQFGLEGSVLNTPLHPAAHAEVLATNAQGEVMALNQRLGEGTVYALGTFVGKRYTDARYPDFERFLKRLVTLSDGLPALDVSAAGSLQWRTGLANGQRLIFVMNPGAAQSVRVSGPADQLGHGQTAHELHSGSNLPIHDQDGRRSIDLQIGEGDFAILAV